jgi:hypothetical protein
MLDSVRVAPGVSPLEIELVRCCIGRTAIESVLPTTSFTCSARATATAMSC